MSSGLADSSWTTYDLPLADQPRPEPPGPSRVSGESDEMVLRRHAAWFCSLRWLVIAALAVLGLCSWASTVFFALPGLRLDPGWPLASAGVLLVLNVAWLAVLRVAHGAWKPLSVRRFLWLQIVLDLVVLTAVIHFIGSLGTFAPFMYLFHIVMACVFLSNGQSLGVTLAGMGVYLACLVLEGTGILAPASVLVESLAPDRSVIPPAVRAWQVGSVIFVSVTVWFLASRLSNALRKRDEELFAANRRLVAATDERADHMLSTTHQLKAPFAAIHANTQLLLGGLSGPLPAEAITVVQQIAARCEMLSRSITEMLQLANLRSRAQDPPPSVRADVSSVIRACLANLQPQAAKRGIVVEEDLSPAVVRAVADHAVMIIDNVLSNAINYSRDGQRVWVSSRAKPDGGATVVVRDCGIGIQPEKLPRIFDDYFRTKEAAQHNRASTGLGLAIVRQTARAGGIGVHVESCPERGTVFSLDFPGWPEAHE